MPANEHSIDLLGYHPDLVPLVARWHWDEWGADYDDSSLDEWTRQLAGKTHTDRLPCSWVAFVDAEPVGSVVLELDGVEPRLELKPDVAGLYVLPSFRNRGIGSALMRACEAAAREFGVPDIYLYTESAETLYARLGWVTIERGDFLGRPVAIMRKSLRATA
ncbi:MAG: GNAT family N-acetyltransferase [Chloroflexota bacterium]|nr:GNAT family N-acetyltransferase [Chloroflexota bacterium]